ncbi:energy-coupling factor transporter ATPase [Oenococcus sicerae]|uniref:Energy-coupling factor transporter ATP-binding protein EcfA2 n=1 Tax=Oenococcus sicerae TaxID=2203724 RepID=A0AAJ1R960_9LACO|nr:energy-coupling factor transporter ATPase [Oenococcus sicerae]MDN6899815.1 energy-coupling factor transporter ATPase [Oenococcus sicerae]QAS70501.1 energy-coupling factor transporter ATPase [Oenococcus sicerae]
MEIIFKHVAYSYQTHTPFQNNALEDINFEIASGSFTSIIGSTGSGKSTVLQLIDGLIEPTGGSLAVGDYYFDQMTHLKKLKNLRQKIGFIFQFAENQLFEETVEKDLMFGPLNFAVDQQHAKENARKILAVVDLPESVLRLSPLDLSGGQRRRIAIAGVLINDPQILLLDEPTVGLDPENHLELMALFKKLNQQEKTIIMVSHDMNDVAKYSDQVIVLNQGKLIKKASPEIIFADEPFLKSQQLALPDTIAFANELKKLGLKLDEPIKDEQELILAIRKQFLLRKKI